MKSYLNLFFLLFLLVGCGNNNSSKQTIETSPYDIFSLGNTNVRDTSAEIISVHDPERHSSGLANIYEYGTPTFDVREVAQDNFILSSHHKFQFQMVFLYR